MEKYQEAIEVLGEENQFSKRGRNNCIKKRLIFQIYSIYMTLQICICIYFIFSESISSAKNTECSIQVIIIFFFEKFVSSLNIYIICLLLLLG